jgi:two-component system chemotaxis response regulator CheB
MKAVRVLIVEDSPVVREHLRRIISADPRLTVAGIAASGEEALAIVDDVAPDVISMDIQLPGIQGFETTRRIMSHRPTPIVVVSGIGMEEVNLTMQALKAGALGVVQKPVSSEHENYLAMANRLCTQLSIMSEVKVIRRRDGGLRGLNSAVPSRVASSVSSPIVPGSSSWSPASSWRASSTPFRILAVGTSTGGPNALLQLLTGLGGDFPLPIAVVQHMTPGFMEGFAEWLSSVTPFQATVVNGPISLVPKTVYLAPTSRHLVLNGCSASPDDGPPVGSHRPSANVLFSSLARSSGSSAIGVLLTGMGEDGALGLGELKTAGAFTIAEDETTAVVYGMPAAAVQLGAVRESLPLPGIAPRILELVASREKG